MPRGQLIINNKDAFTEWGVSLSNGAKATLMAPLALKQRVSNESRLAHGKTTINTNLKKASREFSLEMHMISSSWADYLDKKARWEAMLMGGVLNIKTSWEEGVTYRCLYLSCNTFAEYDGLAKFALRLEEPNPDNR